MEEKQAGVTALVTAYSRAYHATHDDPKIFDDFLADQMFTAEEHLFFDQNLAGLLPLIDPALAESHPNQASALAWVMQLHNGPITLSRSRYTEDRLDEAIQQGVQQYVILGAGLDTFAFRRPELADRLHVFEVDHPTTQALKRQRISMAGWQIPPHLHFVPVDFSRQPLVDALKNAAFDPQKLSFFSWLGVTYYLTQEAIESTLQTIANIAPGGSTLVFDYMDTDAFIPEKAGKTNQWMQNITRQAGEPMKTGFDPQKLAGDLKQLGFSLQDNLSPSEIEDRYFQGRNDHYHASEHVHFINAFIL